MKIIFNIIVCIYLFSSFSFAQDKDSGIDDNWEFNVESNFYFQDPFFILPVLKADYNRIHLEARYNYEELKTFSAWAGYNFSGGENFEYEIIPMAGFITGRIKGFAPGLRLTLGYSGFEFSSESEYVFDSESKENNYYYNFTDLSFSPADWLYFGLSLQRTRVYNTELEYQPGVLAGVSYENLDMTVYFFAPEDEDKYFLMSLSAGF